MKRTEPTLAEKFRFVMSNEKMREEFSNNSQHLTFGSQFNGGSKVKGKKVGVQKFRLAQFYIAAKIYEQFKTN